MRHFRQVSNRIFRSRVKRFALLAILSSVVLVNEPVTWPLALGTLLVIAGIAVVIVERGR